MMRPSESGRKRSLPSLTILMISAGRSATIRTLSSPRNSLTKPTRAGATTCRDSQSFKDPSHLATALLAWIGISDVSSVRERDLGSQRSMLILMRGTTSYPMDWAAIGVAGSFPA